MKNDDFYRGGFVLNIDVDIRSMNCVAFLQTGGSSPAEAGALVFGLF